MQRSPRSLDHASVLPRTEWRKSFCVVVDVAGNCGDHMTGDRAESKSVNTSSQSGTRHPKVHCVQTLHFILKKRVYHIQVLGLTQQHIYGPFLFIYLFCYSNNHINIVPGYAWLIPAAPIVCRQHSGFGGVSTGQCPIALCIHCA